MGGLHRQKGWNKEVKRADYFRRGIFPLGDGRGFIRQISSLEVTRKFQMIGLSFHCLGEAETTIRLSIKSWWILAQVTPF